MDKIIYGESHYNNNQIKVYIYEKEYKKLR